ncbi:MAG: DUF1800 domain-containing protein [Acidobacteria bacterium]|nr:DUF1800 domain-containing protein [Acidobacteriota bacterium]
MADSANLIAHLLRRAGFGVGSDEMVVFADLSYAQAVDRLLNYDAIPDSVDSKIGQPGFLGTTSRGAFSPNTVPDDARQRWLFRMVHSQRPLQEKMTLFWHNYFATGYSKVAGVVGPANATRLMAAKASDDPVKQRGQIELFRDYALGNLRDLLIQVTIDPAMLIWLDGDTNTKAQPQENFGRELMELFSRGVGYYTESDVYAAARVFTGVNLTYNSNDVKNPNTSFTWIYRPNQHETSAKTFSFPIYAGGGKTIPARSASVGTQDGVDLITALANHPETARRVAAKLYHFFVSETIAPDPAFIDQLGLVYLQNGTAIKPVLQALFMSPQFQDESTFFTRYAWPVEYVVRAIKEVGWTGFSAGSTLSPLISMGQELLEPPNVAGWVLGQSWFSTGAMLARMNFGSALAGNQQFRIATAAAGARSSPQALVDFLTSRLTADVDPGVYADLVSYASAGGVWTGSDTQLRTKGAGIVHLILGSAGYQFV